MRVGERIKKNFCWKMPPDLELASKLIPKNPPGFRGHE